VHRHKFTDRFRAYIQRVNDAIVVDAHHDMLLLVARHREAGLGSAFRERWTRDLRAGGVNVQVLPVFLDDEFAEEAALRRALLLVEYLHREVEENPDDLALCLTGDDLDAALAAGKLALILSFEGCEPIGRDVELLATFHRLGLRLCALTWNRRTMLADGSDHDDSGAGLTREGRAAIAELERLGVIVDVTHLSHRGVEQVLGLATRPVIASHSNARALCDTARNLSDEELRGIAATGGVIGVNFFPGFVHPTDRSPERLVDHIEHIASVAGIDHVGLGPDFIKDYFDEVPPHRPILTGQVDDLHATLDGLAYVTDLPALTPFLLTRFGEADTRKILGGNFVRLFRSALGARPEPALAG
jgi:membrane dipeptidase